MGLMKEMMKEIGNKSREFYEFVLPPIDMHLTDKNLQVVIDIPGFSKKDIKLTLCGDILSTFTPRAREAINKLNGDWHIDVFPEATHSLPMEQIDTLIDRIYQFMSK